MSTNSTSINKKVSILFFIILIGSLAGCSSTKPSKFYMLSPITDTAPSSASDSDKKYIVGVGPIKFPEYLARSQIIRFSGSNEVVVGEFNRWAEPVEENVTRVLRTNLNRLLKSSYAVNFPWERALKVRFQVMVDIHQFETTPDGNVDLDAHWTIFKLSEKKTAEIVRSFKYRKKLDGMDYSKIVAQKSTALEMMSKDIAKEMQKLLDNQKMVAMP